MKLWRVPLDIDKFPTPHGEIHIIPERCKGCGLCTRFCPHQVLGVSEIKNGKGYHIPQAVHPKQCVACRLCQLLCPEFAIYVVEAEDGDSQQDD